MRNLPGKPVPKHELLETFEGSEGAVQLIYGRIRQGKSTEAVRRMIESLSNGKVVYSNLLLDLSAIEFDDRLKWSVIVRNNLYFEERFYRFEKSNYRYFNPVTGGNEHWKDPAELAPGEAQHPLAVQYFDPKVKGAEVRWLNTLMDCEIYYDEGQWLLDSYEATDASVAKRKLITETGHCNRLIVIIAQRTQSVHVNARGNVNQFFRCSKHVTLYPFLVFPSTCLVVEEFQDMKGQDVDETAEPVSVERYFFNKKYWKYFNTHALRAGRKKSQEVHFEAFDLSYWERWYLVFRPLLSLLPGLSREQREERASAPSAERSEAAVLNSPDTDLFASTTPLPPERKFREAEYSESLGVEPEEATIKNAGGLNTNRVGEKKPLHEVLPF